MIIFFVLSFTLLVVMHIRNKMTFNFRMKILSKSTYDFESREFIPYKYLPNYKKMWLSIWVWNFNNFLPKDRQ